MPAIILVPSNRSCVVQFQSCSYERSEKLGAFTTSAVVVGI
jgi:hypothetical protein